MPKDDWPTFYRVHNRAPIPFGFVQDEDDPLASHMDTRVLPYLEKALDAIDDMESFRVATDWLLEKIGRFTDRTISHQGLANIWKRKRGKDKNSTRAIKLRAQEKAKAAITPKEKAKTRLVHKQAAAKRSLTSIAKKLATFEPDPVVVDPNADAQVLEVISDVVVADEPKDDVVFTPNAGPQTEFLAASEFQVLYGGAAGGGKEIQLNQVLSTPSGSKALGDIEVWDEVIDRDGNPCHVTSLSPISTNSELYEFEFDDGTKVVSCVDHQWVTYTTKERDAAYKRTEEYRAKRRASRPSRAKSTTSDARKLANNASNSNREYKYLTPPTGTVRTTREIVDTLYVRGDRVNHGVPLTGALNLPEADLPIDPYVLGSWLGDGCKNGGGFGGIDPEIWERIEKAGYVVTHNAKDNVHHYIKGLVQKLKKLNLHRNKHIPMQYLRASKAQRLALLQGLMDTDGTVRKESGHPSFCNTNEAIIDGAIDIICSLGWKVRKQEGRATLYGVDHGPKWTLNFTPTEKVFHLSRKRSAQTTGIRKVLNYRYIVSAKPVPSEPTRCITVDSPSNTYLITNNHIVTHNSYALLADPMRYFDNPNFRGLLVRRTNDELRELKWKAQELYPRAFPKAKWREKTSEWIFPSGAQLWLTYLERDDDVLRYQGQSFTWVAFDELTQYPTAYAWNYLSSRVRSTDPSLPLAMRASTNPSGAGMAWVKRMFIDPSPAGQAFVATDIETGEKLVQPDVYQKGHPKAGEPNANAGKPLFKRKFIAANLYDNPYLAADGKYEASLLALPETQRRQLLEGDWAMMEGAAFPNFRTSTHTIDPYNIPPNWTRFRAADYGYASHSAVLWFAIDPAYDTLIVYRELYVSKANGQQLADMILEIEQEDKVSYGVLDSSVWHNRGQIGPSIAEEMIARGVRWRPSDRGKGSRTAGFNMLQKLLVEQDIGMGQTRPSIQIFNTCRQLISDISSAPISPKGVDDIDERYASDHTYDALRYGIMSRPKSYNDFGQDNFSRKSAYSPADTTFGY